MAQTTDSIEHNAPLKLGDHLQLLLITWKQTFSPWTVRPTIDEVLWDTTATNKLVTKGTLTPQKIKLSSDKIPDSFSLPLIRCISLTKAIKTFKISLQNSRGGVIPLIKQYLNFFHQGHYNTAYYTPRNNLASLNERITQYDLRQIEFPFVFSSFYKFSPRSWRSKNDLQRRIVPKSCN